MEVVRQKAISISQSNRFPAGRVVVIPTAGSPLDREVYCRLSPNHMDVKENLSKFYSTVYSSVNTIPLSDAAIDSLVSRSPITDQLFFNKYLLTVAPTVAYRILFKNKSNNSNENLIKNIPKTDMNVPMPMKSSEPPPKSLSIHENNRGGNTNNINNEKKESPKTSGLGLGLADRVQETINNVNKNSLLNNRMDNEMNSGNVFIV